ncbi:MAG: hypothetical protein V4641_28645 [Pseudomonadota bacterium]
MSEHIYLLTLALPLAAIVAVFGLRALAAVKQARLRFENDEEYRQIAEKSAAAQTETAAALKAMSASLADVQSRLAQVEKVLKEVE